LPVRSNSDDILISPRVPFAAQRGLPHGYR
jgi:hypothetical protein